MASQPSSAQLVESLAGEMGQGRNSHRVTGLCTQLLAANDGLDMRVHPYGFAHCQLWTGPAGESLRLHIWLPDHPMRSLPTRAHCHAWRLRSAILLGELTNELYSVQESDAGEFRLFAVAYRDSTSVRVPTALRVNCALASAAHYRAGDSYSVEVGDFHQTRVPSGTLTATLLLADCPSSKPLVVGLAGEEEEYAFERSTLSSTDGQAVVRLLADGLKALG